MKRFKGVPSLCLILVIAAGTAGPLAGGQSGASASLRASQPNGPESANVPLKAVTLYRSGVGSFERAGQVEGDTSILLEFESELINDVLKSMVVVDQSGGSVGAISYASKEPLSRRLASLGIDISDDPSVGNLLSRLRGAPVRFNTTEGVISGSVLSVETRARKDAPNQPVANVLTGSGVRSVYLWDTLGFEIMDEALAADLERALGMLAQERQDNVKGVSVDLSGSGKRQVVLSYVHEMPVWKTSYRLVLGPTKANGARVNDDKDPNAFLQGWAIVENTTDEDWDDIRLSLVSGQQVSFKMDLYEPVYTERPEVPVPLGLQASAIEYEDDYAEVPNIDFQRPLSALKNASPAPEAGQSAMVPRSPGVNQFRYEVERGKSMLESMGEAAAAADPEAAGEVFQYTLRDAISIQRRRSAMLPIISSKILAERVSILSPGMSHPMRGARLRVPENIQLIPGAIAVYDEVAFAGDARVGFVSGGDDRLISYASDLDVTASVDTSSDFSFTKVKVVAGTVQVTTSQTRKTVYKIDNNDRQHGRTLLIEHPKLPGWERKPTEGKVEETDSAYRLELSLAPDKEQSVTVTLSRPTSSHVAILDHSVEQLQVYVRGGLVPADLVKAFEEASRLRARVNEAESALGSLNAERQSISTEQARIRQNIAAIDRQSELYARYMRTLTSQEDRLEAITKEVEAAEKELQERRDTLTNYLLSINIG